MDRQEEAVEVCRRCRERGRPSNFGSEPKCAWPDGGAFNPENWQCATANELRDLAYEAVGKNMWDRYCTRTEDESLAVLWVPSREVDGRFCGGAFFIVMTYYKDRGRTSGIHYALDGVIRPLTLAEAEEAIEILIETARNAGSAQK